MLIQSIIDSDGCLYWHSILSMSTHGLILTQYIQTDRSYADTAYSGTCALVLTQCMETQRSYTDAMYSPLPLL